MAIKDVIRERALQAAQKYKLKFINEQKGEYEQTVAEYEELLTEHYQLEFRLEFLRAIDKHYPQAGKDQDLEELKQHQIVLLKKIKDIENSGILEKYDAVLEAINAVNDHE